MLNLLQEVWVVQVTAYTGLEEISHVIERHIYHSAHFYSNKNVSFTHLFQQ